MEGSIRIEDPFIITLVVLGVLWTLPLKGVALWKAAGRKDLYWFIAILVLNTLAVLEILYIFVFSKRRKKEPVTAA
ncbi:MAG: DUF5652 family protein [Patescibacteria group bacterium]